MSKRLLRLTGPAVEQETFDADIFVQIRPMNSLAAGDQTPVGALRWRPTHQTREPRDRDPNRPAIRKVRDYRVIAYAYAQGKRFPELTP